MIKALPRNRKRLASGIAENIRDDIASKQISPGTALPTAKELAAYYRVSQVTANRALETLVAEGLVYRIKGHGSFVAESKLPDTSYTIGLELSTRVGEPKDILNAAFDVFPNTVMDYLERIGHHIKPLPAHELLDPEGKFSSDIDGFIISPEFINRPDVIANLQQSGKDVVMIRQTNFQDLPFHQVIPDLRPGFSQALELFWSQGHERIIIADCRGVPENLARRKMFLQSALKSGFPVGNISFVSRERLVADLGRTAGRQIGQEILDNAQEKPAVFCVGDLIAFGIVDAVHERGLEVGRDLDLISFDNLEASGLCPFDEPLLTSVSFPRAEIARAAVDLLIDQLANGKGYLQTIRIPTELVIRKSAMKFGNI